MLRYRIKPIGVGIWEIQERFLGFFWRSIYNYETDLSFTYARSIEQAEAIIVKLKKKSDDAHEKRKNKDREFRRNNPTLYR